MIHRFGEAFVLEQLKHQLESLYIRIREEEKALLDEYLKPTMERVENCFSASKNKYYFRIVDGRKETYFDPLHSCQWFIFLYYFANTIHRALGGGRILLRGSSAMRYMV